MREWDLNVQRMLDFIELHLAEPVALDQLAKRLGYSPWYCTRRFRQTLGLSFRTYLGMRRLGK
jgi:AraC-like DNA-binding protein